jgi:acyl-CoA thioester hydrolase
VLKQHEVQIRVRYSETDAMGYLHHSNYLSYFEIGRTELFRAQGGNYREMEECGLFFVVASVKCSFHAPARYDDLLKLRTTLAKVSFAKLEHEYEIFRDGTLLARATVVLACVDRNGKVQRVDEILPDSD